MREAIIGHQHAIRGPQSSAHHEWDDDERIIEHEAFCQLDSPHASRRDDQDELDVEQPTREHLMRDAISGHQMQSVAISGHQQAAREHLMRDAINGHHWSLATIKGRQWHQWPARSHLDRIFAHHREEYRDRFRMYDELPT